MWRRAANRKGECGVAELALSISGLSGLNFEPSMTVSTSRFVLPLRFACGRGKQVLQESKYNASALIKIIMQYY
jgi:hypothetical protein